MATIGDMPHEILCEIMKVAGQPARVQSLLACKALHAAVTAAGTWNAITFGDLDCTAVEFMAKHRCPRVTVISVVPDDIAWFLHRLADLGHGDCITRLELDIGPVQRLPEDLLAAAARHSQLQSLDITVEDLDQSCELTFPYTAATLNLKRLRIVDLSAELKQLIVWFDGSQSRFPSLESLELDVGLSDVLAGACHMPRLRRLVYRSDDEDGGETYEDANLTGCQLDLLDIDVSADADMRFLCRQMRRASIRRLVLNVTDEFLDVSREMSPALEELVLRMGTTQADVEIDFPFLQTYRNLRRIEMQIGAPWICADPAVEATCEHCVVFQHVPSIAEWMRFMGRLELALLPTTRVCISPV